MKKSFILSLAVLFSLSAIAFSCAENKEGDKKEDKEKTEKKEEKVADADKKEEAPAPKKAKSPRMQAEGEIDGVKVSIDYGAPSVRDRKIWGGLEAYGKVWRAGANETTAITFDQDVTVNGEAVAAGTYAFFIIPNENEDWVVILNEEWSQEKHSVWGAYNYKEEKDVLRVNVAPTWADEVTEQLKYEVADGAVHFAWEKAGLSLSIAKQ